MARKEERAKKKEEMLAAKMQGGDQSDEGKSMSGSDKESKSGSKSKDGSDNKNKTGSKRSGSADDSGSQSQQSDGFDDEEGSEQNEEQEDDEQYDAGVGDLPSAPEMQQELISAINDEREEYENLKRQNDDLQRKIMLMDNSTRDFDKQSEQMLNEHKYLNTLANVHQVRFNLKETQDRYNRMASELQAKLNEKQAKCKEIEHQFKELKRSVA